MRGEMPGGVCGAVSGMPAGNGLGSSSFSRRAVHDCGLRGAASPHESDWTPSCAARLPNSGRQETRYAARATAARWQKVPETQMARRSGAVVKSSTDGWAAAVNESGEEHQELKTRARAQCEDRTQRPGSLWAWGGGFLESSDLGSWLFVLFVPELSTALENTWKTFNTKVSDQSGVPSGFWESGP